MRNAESWKFISNGEMGTNLEPPILGPGQPICTRLRGWCFSLLMLLSALFGSIYMIAPVIPLIFWNPKLWRKLMDRLVGLWVIMPGALMEYLFGTEVSIKGDLIEHDEPALIIMNHRTRLDWLFFWNALYRMNPWLCTSEKISMKGILKYVPGAGWAMGANSYIFLDRSFEKDKTKLDSMIQYYASIGYNYQLLLFPEGTDKCPLATERSRVYAEKNNLAHYDYVLQPRTTGFVHIVQTMRRTNYIKYLYDVTVAFPENLVQSEVDMVCQGVCPNKVQYEVRKIPIDALPSDDEGLATWIKKLWAEKEEKLRRYYSKPMEQRSWDAFLEEYKKSEQAQYMQILCIIMWVFTTGFWLTAFFEVTFMMVFALIAVCIFVLIEKTCGGIEWLAIREFNRSRAASSDPVPLDPTGRLPRPSED